MQCMEGEIAVYLVVTIDRVLLKTVTIIRPKTENVVSYDFLLGTGRFDIV